MCVLTKANTFHHSQSKPPLNRIWAKRYAGLFGAKLMLEPEEEIKLTTRTIKTILKDTQKSAEAINLVYVDDSRPGIFRVRNGDTFEYISGGKKIRDKTTLERIKKLVIPPAWEQVWICELANGHLQATGIDAKKRKQYKYHPLWTALRNHTKFFRLHHFGQTLAQIRQQVEKDLAKPGLPAEKVLAAVVCLMDQTGIRIGNSAYEKLYGSFGLTTLKDQHVKISGDRMQFIFKGKKGITQKISIKNKRLARIVKNCRDIPGKELFQYVDHEGNHKSIDSGMVNAYIKSIAGEDFTAKDFRTWAGTVHAIATFRDLAGGETQAQIKRDIVAALDRVADRLGNTRAVCKKYYVHPLVIRLYEDKRLHTYLSLCENLSQDNGVLCAEERILLTILEKEGPGLKTTSLQHFDNPSDNLDKKLRR